MVATSSRASDARKSMPGPVPVRRLLGTADSVLDRTARPAARWAIGHALPSRAMQAAGRKGDLQGQMFAATLTDDPFPAFERLRAHGALIRGRFTYVSVSHPVVKAVLSSNDFRAGFDPSQMSGPLAHVFRWATQNTRLGPLEPPSLLVTEPPDHTRYRKLVTRVFTVRAVEQLRERTEQIAADLLDELASAGTAEPVDMVERYCSLLPVTVISEILGVPAADRDKVLAFGAAAAPSLDMGLGWRQFRQVESALAGFERWLDSHIARLREESGDDLLSQLVAARDEGGGLNDAELKATAGLVLAAGFETTVNLLGNGIALLHQQPEQLEALRGDPSLWANATDEVLRYDPPVLLTGRNASQDVEIAGTVIPERMMVTTVLAGANRDPDVFDDPNRFDVARTNAREHVSFSAGRHHCLGAALARMEGEVGLRALFNRFPDLEVRPGGRRRTTRILRGYEVLPVRLGREAGAPA